MRDTTSNGSRLGRCASNSAFVCGDSGHVLSHPLTLADGPSVLPCLRPPTPLRPMCVAFQVRLSAHCMPGRLQGIDIESVQDRSSNRQQAQRIRWRTCSLSCEGYSYNPHRVHINAQWWRCHEHLPRISMSAYLALPAGGKPRKKVTPPPPPPPPAPPAGTND